MCLCCRCNRFRIRCSPLLPFYFWWAFARLRKVPFYFRSGKATAGRTFIRIVHHRGQNNFSGGFIFTCFLEKRDICTVVVVWRRGRMHLLHALLELTRTNGQLGCIFLSRWRSKRNVYGPKIEKRVETRGVYEMVRAKWIFSKNNSSAVTNTKTTIIYLHSNAVTERWIGAQRVYLKRPLLSGFRMTRRWKSNNLGPNEKIQVKFATGWFGAQRVWIWL